VFRAVTAGVIASCAIEGEELTDRELEFLHQYTEEIQRVLAKLED
jgi:hypothetical protein